MISTRHRQAIAVAIVLACFNQLAHAGYTFTNLYSVAPNPSFSGQPDYVGVGGQSVGLTATYIFHGSEQGAIWNGSSTPINVQPVGMPGITASILNYTNGTQQVGAGFTFVTDGYITSEIDHAMLWNGTAASAVDLHPAALGFADSSAYGTDGIHQVGNAWGNSRPFSAMLWSGTAASAVNLNPTALFGPAATSQAFRVDGNHQVGIAASTSTGATHAVLWTGTADSAVDLQPAGTSFKSTTTMGLGGSQQVGYGATSNSTNALLWTGTAASIVNLNAPNFFKSVAFATNGAQQVGDARILGESGQRAVVWSGTADSAVVLSQFMPLSPTGDPANPFVDSIAMSIDSQGNIFGRAFDAQNNGYVVEWSNTPEPSLLLSTAGVLALVGMRRKRRAYANDNVRLLAHAKHKSRAAISGAT